MNRYRILRENEELGPFTVEEIAGRGLYSSDRVWLEGRSTDWNAPADVPELSAFLCKGFTAGYPDEKGENTNQSGNDIVSPHLTASDPQSGPEPEKGCEGSLIWRKDPYHYSLVRREERRASPLSRARVLLLSFLSGGLLLGALSLHSLADGRYAGKSNPFLHPQNADGMNPEYNDYQTALRFESIPKPDTPVEMKRAKVIRPKNLRKMVLVKGSRYDGGLSGGIQDLQLTLSNNSAHAIDKATIAVDYLHSNGALIRSERFTVQHLKGNASRTVDVPSSRRGVKVRYRVTDVQSKAFSDELRQL